MTSGTFEVVEGLEAKLGHLPGGLWTESSQSAITMPILGTDRRPVGMLVLGVNVRRAFDDDYSYSPLPTPLIPPILPPSYISLTHRGYFELVTGQVSKAIGSATALQEEKKRAAILAELDRSKTIFFSNVSHEFRYAHHIAHSHLPHSFRIHTILTTYRRWVTTKHLSSHLMLASLSLFLLSSSSYLRTPLTLIMGPLEDSLTDTLCPLPPAHHERLTIVQRNAMRLLRLVNSILDFSRIEAGRMQVDSLIPPSPHVSPLFFFICIFSFLFSFRPNTKQ